MLADNPRLKKLIIIALVLGVAQVLVLTIMGAKTSTQPIRTAIEKAVQDVPNVSNERRQLLKVQLALADFLAKHNGTPPATLNELIPTYFDILPVDPSTNKPYLYKVEGKRYTLGDPTQFGAKNASSSAVKSPSKTGQGAIGDQKDALLKTLKEDGPKSPAYDPTGKKDPFRPFDIAPQQDRSIQRLPLESQPLDQFSYLAYLQSGEEPKAIVETPEGRGYTITKGTKIGTNSGEVTDILPDKIVIVESEIDFTGQRQTKTIELPIGVRRGAESKEGASKGKGR